MWYCLDDYYLRYGDLLCARCIDCQVTDRATGRRVYFSFVKADVTQAGKESYFNISRAQCHHVLWPNCFHVVFCVNLPKFKWFLCKPKLLFFNQIFYVSQHNYWCDALSKSLWDCSRLVDRCGYFSRYHVQVSCLPEIIFSRFFQLCSIPE